MAEEWKQGRSMKDPYHRRVSRGIAMSYIEVEMVEKIMKVHNLQTFSSAVRWLVYQEMERMENETGRR